MDLLCLFLTGDDHVKVLVPTGRLDTTFFNTANEAAEGVPEQRSDATFFQIKAKQNSVRIPFIVEARSSDPEDKVEITRNDVLKFVDVLQCKQGVNFKQHIPEFNYMAFFLGTTELIEEMNVSAKNHIVWLCKHTVDADALLQRYHNVIMQLCRTRQLTPTVPGAKALIEELLRAMVLIGEKTPVILMEHWRSVDSTMGWDLVRRLTQEFSGAKDQARENRELRRELHLVTDRIGALAKEVRFSRKQIDEFTPAPRKKKVDSMPLLSLGSPALSPSSTSHRMASIRSRMSPSYSPESPSY